MAILIEQTKRGINWFGVIISIVLLAAIFVGGYFLFFAPTPGIEVVAPLQFQSAIDLAKITFDPSAVVNSRQFKSLKIYTGLPSAGALGRENPFKPY